MEHEDFGFYKHFFEEDEIYLLQESKNNELKDICLILDKKLTAKDELFLSKILVAVHQSLVSVSKLYSQNIDELNTLKTKIVIIFDDEAFLEIPFYSVLEIGHLKVLKSNSLEKINSEKALKASLWTELQKMFLK